MYTVVDGEVSRRRRASSPIDDRTLRRLTRQAPHAHDANAEAEQATATPAREFPPGPWNEPHRLGLEDSRLSDRVVEPDGWTWRGRAQEANQEVIGPGDDRIRAILRPPMASTSPGTR
jgi:hypothetical protein